MIAATDTLERVAMLLEGDERERFYAMIARFRSVPEDDEYLQILEAIGFMTLIWSRVPTEVETILAGANPITESCQSVATHVEKAVSGAIPSQEDLRQIVQSLGEHELVLESAIRSIQPVHKTSSGSLPVVAAFLLGVVVSLSLVIGLNTLRTAGEIEPSGVEGTAR